MEGVVLCVIMRFINIFCFMHIVIFFLSEVAALTSTELPKLSKLFNYIATASELTKRTQHRWPFSYLRCSEALFIMNPFVFRV